MEKIEVIMKGTGHKMTAFPSRNRRGNIVFYVNDVLTKKQFFAQYELSAKDKFKYA